MGLREKKRAKVRQTILDICENLFRTKGFDETGIDEIIEKSEISRQTFFNYFSGKEAVLTELGLEWLKKQIEPPRAGAAVKNPVSVLEGTRKALIKQAEAIQSDREFMTLVLTRSRLFSGMDSQDQRRVQEQKSEHVRNIFTSLADLIRYAQKTGEICPEIDADQAAEIFASSMLMTIRLWLTGYWGENDSLQDRMLGTMDILMRGFRR